MPSPTTRLHSYLTFLYGAKAAGQVGVQLRSILERWEQELAPHQRSAPQLDERDAILITYGDQVQAGGQAPLETLAIFLEQHLAGVLNGLHILPFFPYSSDDGFSVIDYRRVDPNLGSWAHIERLGKNFRLMFDAVINHISRESDWFQAFLRQEEPYRDYFISVEQDSDLSMVVRPRALPLLTRVETSAGEKFAWTTFSEDQIDLDFSNPDVLLEIVDLLLFYVSKGADFIRLDAIAYLWKKIGSASIHLPETHTVVKLFRAALDLVAPPTILITETNVPHSENISYFGEALPDAPAGDEAQMVYQFSLGPLMLHTFHSGDAGVLRRWAASLETPFPTATYFNFIASHDGIGVRPAEGLLSGAEIQALVERTLAHGGQVSYKTNADGTQSAYELNITLYDALNDPANPHLEMDVARFLATQAIMLALPGVPGVYIHSLFGSRNCLPCFEDSGRARSLNREKFQLEEMEVALQDKGSHTARVFDGYTKLLKLRRAQPAFHPQAIQKVLNLPDSCLGLLRQVPEGGQNLFCLTSVVPEAQELTLDVQGLNLPAGDYLDLITGEHLSAGFGRLAVLLEAYQTRWLQHAI